MANDKKSYGGKYKLNNEWGVRHWLHQKDWGEKMTFEGSGSKTYIYRRPQGGIVIVHADNLKDAQRIARTNGYKRYIRNRGN